MKYPTRFFYSFYYRRKNKLSWDSGLFGRRAEKKIKREKITKCLGFLLAIVAGFSCGIIAAVSLATVFPGLAGYYWLLGTVMISGIVLEGSVYAHHLSSIFTDVVFLGFFSSVEKKIIISHMLKDKKVRKLLLTHYVRFAMGRIKEKNSKSDFLAYFL